MDTLVSKLPLRGEYGYVAFLVKKYRNTSLYFFAGVVVFVVLSGLVPSSAEPFLRLISIFLILPMAQNLAKYLAFKKYKYMKASEYKEICNISSDFLVLGELPLIRMKRVYMLMCSVVTKTEIICLIPSKENQRDYRQDIENILKPKGFQLPVVVYTDYDAFKDYLLTNIKSKAQNPNVAELEKIAEVLIKKAN